MRPSGGLSPPSLPLTILLAQSCPVDGVVGVLLARRRLTLMQSVRTSSVDLFLLSQKFGFKSQTDCSPAGLILLHQKFGPLRVPQRTSQMRQNTSKRVARSGIVWNDLSKRSDRRLTPKTPKNCPKLSHSFEWGSGRENANQR